ncbi:hypothetical protein DFH05DRAFT_255422 [Lentinula detonsa]|uniref:Uncharacterized protein n=1 Tax=Lentinula detonsa TaxID=2804962 RepID=A0A9W8TVE2_9AGAR|nr:hypothetical protein DFH05DRAFT_255422 [Lentinula detonsa]
MRFLTVLLPFLTLALHVAATDLEAQQSSPAQQPCTACIQKAKRIAAREANTAILSCFFVGASVVAFYEGAQHGLFGRGEGSLPNCQSLDCSKICAPFYCIKNPNVQREMTRRQSISVGSNWIDNWKDAHKALERREGGRLNAFTCRSCLQDGILMYS